MDGPVKKLEGETVVLTKIIHLPAFLPILSCDGRAAVTETISVLLGFLKTIECAAAALWDTLNDFTMRKMNDLPV